jgi:hypothetical protein
VTDEGKEKKVNIDFEPFKPINTSLYLCDNKVGIIHVHSSTTKIEIAVPLFTTTSVVSSLLQMDVTGNRCMFSL